MLGIRLQVPVDHYFRILPFGRSQAGNGRVTCASHTAYHDIGYLITESGARHVHRSRCKLQHVILGFPLCVLVGSVNEGPLFRGPSASLAYHIEMMENMEEVEWGGQGGTNVHVNHVLRSVTMSGLRMPITRSSGSALHCALQFADETSHWLQPLTTFNFIKTTLHTVYT